MNVHGSLLLDPGQQRGGRFSRAPTTILPDRSPLSSALCGIGMSEGSATEVADEEPLRTKKSMRPLGHVHRIRFWHFRQPEYTATFAGSLKNRSSTRC
jgi:hypothetical protein